MRKRRIRGVATNERAAVWAKRPFSIVSRGNSDALPSQAAGQEQGREEHVVHGLRTSPDFRSS